MSTIGQQIVQVSQITRWGGGMCACVCMPGHDDGVCSAHIFSSSCKASPSSQVTLVMPNFHLILH